MAPKSIQFLTSAAFAKELQSRGFATFLLTALAYIRAVGNSPAQHLKELLSALKDNKQRQISRPVKQLVAGGVAGAVSKSIVAPLERVSTLVMAEKNVFSVERAAVHAWKDGGLRGLFRGNSATLAKIFPSSAIQFGVFHTLKDRILASRGFHPGMGGELRNSERLAAGALAGAASVAVTYPLESMRTLMSVSGGIMGSLPHVFSSVIKSHGVGALYKGFRATMIGDVMGNALGFTAYELANKLYKDVTGTSAPATTRGLLGAMSASVVVTITMPMEVVRRRLQLQGTMGRPILYNGTWDAVKTILAEEGILKGFYSASLPIYLKVPFSIGVMYMCYDFLSGESVVHTSNEHIK